MKVQCRCKTPETGKIGFLDGTTAFCNFYISCVLEVYKNLFVKARTLDRIATAVCEAYLDAVCFILVTYLDL